MDCTNLENWMMCLYSSSKMDLLLKVFRFHPINLKKPKVFFLIFLMGIFHMILKRNIRMECHSNPLTSLTKFIPKKRKLILSLKCLVIQKQIQMLCQKKNSYNNSRRMLSKMEILYQLEMNLSRDLSRTMNSILINLIITNLF